MLNMGSRTGSGAVSKTATAGFDTLAPRHSGDTPGSFSRQDGCLVSSKRQFDSGTGLENAGVVGLKTRV